MTPIALPQLPETPLVSVLVTNYNYAPFLATTVASLQRQTYPNWEAVVCDDGSTDDSRSILERLAADEPRLRLFLKANGGQCSAFNHAAGHVTGDIVCVLDADDEFDPEKLERVVAAFKSHPDAGVCTHYLRAIDAVGKVILRQTPNCLDSGWLPERAFERGCSVNVPVSSGMSFRTEVLRLLTPMPAGLKTDADGYLFMAAQFLSPFVAIDAALASYRVHGKNMGGLIDMTIPRLTHEIRLIRARTMVLSEFLRQRFGNDVASVDMGFNPHLIQTVLKLRALGGDAATAEFAPTPDLVRRNPSRMWRYFWTSAFMLPGWLRIPLLRLASRSYSVKGFVVRAMAQARRAPAAAT